MNTYQIISTATGQVLGIQTQEDSFAPVLRSGESAVLIAGGSTLGSGTFVGASNGAAVQIAGNFSVTLTGTFVATVVLERTFDGATWLPVTYIGGTGVSFTAPAATVWQEPERGVTYRVRCSAYTSGTVAWRFGAGTNASDQYPDSLWLIPWLGGTGGVRNRGGYNAATNTPAIGTGGTGGTGGDVFIVTTAGTVTADGIGAVKPPDQIQHTGTAWIRAAVSAGLGTVAAEDAESLDTTGGRASGYDYYGLSGGDYMATGDSRVPDIAYAWTDGAGNIGAYVDSAGMLVWPAIQSANVAAQAAVITTLTAAVTNIDDNALVIPTDQRMDGLTHAWTDATGAPGAGFTFDGTFWAVNASFVNLTISAAPTLPGHAVNKAYLDTLFGVGGTFIVGTIDAGVYQVDDSELGSGDQRIDGLAHAWADASGTAGAGIGYDGVWRFGDASGRLLTLTGAPVNPTHATTKDYVDSAIATVGSGLLEPHANYAAVGDGVTDDSAAFNACVAAAVAAGSRYIAVERPYYVPTLSRQAGHVIMLGEGRLIGAPLRKYVIPARSMSPPPPTRNLMARAHCPRFTTACRAGAAKVILTGDSVSTPGQAGFSFFSAFNAKLREKIINDNPGVAIDWLNRGIGGQTWARLNTTPTAFPLWYSNPATPWLDYIQAELPDLLIISFSRNDGAALLHSDIQAVLAKVAAWPHPCDVVVTTSVGESQAVDLSGGAVNAITTRNSYEYASGLIRSFAMSRGIGLIDSGRRESLVRFGYDPENCPLLIDPAVTGGTVSTTVYDLPLPFTWPSTVYGYGIKGWIPPGKWATLGNEISFEIGNTSLAGNRGCKFWMKRDPTTKQIAYKITTTRTADGGNADSTFVPYTDAVGWVVPDADDTLFNFQLQGSRVYFGPSGGVAATADETIERIVYNAPVPRMGGMWQPVIRCAAGSVSGALKAFLFDTSAVVLSSVPAKPCLYMPGIIDQEFGGLTYSENLWGGGVPHPSAVACELILQPAIDAADFSTAA